MIDMTGQTYGRLLVTGYAGSRFRGRAARAAWHCKYECGNTIEATGAHLREGTIQSCGCLRDECQRDVRGKYSRG